MHCLYGLKAQNYSFELKGGTSLSKGFGLIHRFSEDIDIRIEPPKSAKVSIGKNQNKPAHCDSRKTFYDQLAEEIDIEGIDDADTRKLYQSNYQLTAALYYQEQPSFDALLGRIQSVIHEL